MKVIVDVPHEIICKRYIGANDQIWMVHAIKNGKPLPDILNEIKTKIEKEQTTYKPWSGEYYGLALCLDIIDKYIDG